jgi:hypothetical protein
MNGSGRMLNMNRGVAQIAGLNADHLTKVTPNGVEIRKVRPEQVRARFTKITFGPMGTNLRFTGDGVITSSTPATMNMSFSCANKFVPCPD